MNLKNFGNNSAAIPVLVKRRHPLIATATTPVAASPAITSASTTVAAAAAGIIRARGRIGSAMITPAQEMASTIAATGIGAAVRSCATARSSPRSAILDLRYQNDDQRTAGRDNDCRQRIHGFPAAPDEDRGAPQKPRNGLYWSPNMAASFIDHSSGMWNFHRYRPLYPQSCSIRKVMP